MLLQVRVRPVRRGLAVLLACTLLAGGCGFRGLSFRVDERVDIVAPEDRSAVELPVTVEWEVTDFEITGPQGDPRPDGGYFGVFVNRAPQPPGEPMEWHARDDDSCVAAQGCPDDDWYARRFIFATTETALTLEVLPRQTDDRREFHEVTVVLLDADGRRIGESAFAVNFEVVRSR